MDVAGGSRAYEEEGEELDPAVEWKQSGEEQDVVEIRLPGFRKEHVRVQVDNYGVLRVTGGRPARGGRWIRFTKDLRLPDGCDADGVRARFEDDKLLITLPIVAAGAGDTASTPPSPSPPPKPLPKTSSFRPPFSVPPPPPLPPPPGKPNFFEPKLRPPLLPPRLPPPPPPPPPRPVKPTAFEPKLRPPLPPPREPISRPLPSFPAKPPTVFEPKPSSPPPPPPPAKSTAFEPKLRPQLPLPREPSSRPRPPFPANTFEPKPPPPPPREPATAPLFPSGPPPPPATSTAFMPKPPPPPPPPPPPARLPSFPPPPPRAKSTFFNPKLWLPGRHSDHAPASAPEPAAAKRKPAAAERKPWAPPAIVLGPNTAEPEPRPSPPRLPPWKQSTSNVPEPKSPTLSDIPKSPTLSDIPIAMASPSPPPPPPPPRRRIPDATEKTKKHGMAQEGAGKVRLPLLEEMKKKEKQKMEGRKAREAANAGSGTPAVDERRGATLKLPPPANKDPAMTTTNLVANMAAAAAVLVGIALSVWRTVSGSS